MYLPFLSAGCGEVFPGTSVRPDAELGNLSEEESDGSGEGDNNDVLGSGEFEGCEKVSIGKEGDFVRKLVDPCLPKRRRWIHITSKR